MDRRGFLTRIGLGSIAAVATSQLVLPATTALAEPARKIFLPPVSGWVPQNGDFVIGQDGQVLTFKDGTPQWVWPRPTPVTYTHTITIEGYYDPDLRYVPGFRYSPEPEQITYTTVSGKQVTGYVDSVRVSSYGGDASRIKLRIISESVDAWREPARGQAVGGVVPDRWSIDSVSLDPPRTIAFGRHLLTG